jgi:hypothetical protein
VFKPGKAPHVGEAELKLEPPLEWTASETLRIQMGRAQEPFSAEYLVLEFAK